MLCATTQVLTGTAKKMHLFHRMYDLEGNLAATSETILVNMDLSARKASLPEPRVATRLAEFADQHAGLTTPDGASRHVGAPLNRKEAHE